MFLDEDLTPTPAAPPTPAPPPRTMAEIEAHYKTLYPPDGSPRPAPVTIEAKRERLDQLAARLGFDGDPALFDEYLDLKRQLEGGGEAGGLNDPRAGMLDPKTPEGPSHELLMASLPELVAGATWDPELSAALYNGVVSTAVNESEGAGEFYRVMSQLAQRSHSTLAAPWEQTETRLRAEWGTEYEAKVAAAGDAISILFPNATARAKAEEWLNTTGYGDDYELVKLAAAFVEKHRARQAGTAQLTAADQALADARAKFERKTR